MNNNLNKCKKLHYMAKKKKKIFRKCLWSKQSTGDCVYSLHQDAEATRFCR